jgi:hypothetical protein
LAAANLEFPALREHCREVFESSYTESAFVRRRTELYRATLDPSETRHAS